MDSKGYLYAAEMTDLLTTVFDRSEWDVAVTPELGSLGRLFAHMVRVRGVYRDSLLFGTVVFPGVSVERGEDLEEQLVRSRTELAQVISTPKVDRIRWGTQWMSPMEIYTTAVQHEGIHQGQWHVALKHTGHKIPMRWQTDWFLM